MVEVRFGRCDLEASAEKEERGRRGGGQKRGGFGFVQGKARQGRTKHARCGSLCVFDRCVYGVVAPGRRQGILPNKINSGVNYLFKQRECEPARE